MSAIVSSIKTWRFAILYFSLYSINSLGSVMLAALTGTTWSTLDGQSKFLIILAIVTNWTNTILSFVSHAAKKVESGQPLFNDTTFINKPQ